MTTFLNVVTCGECGEVFGHKLNAETLTCPYCEFQADICDFPDLYYFPERKDSVFTISANNHD